MPAVHHLGGLVHSNCPDSHHQSSRLASYSGDHCVCWEEHRAGSIYRQHSEQNGLGQSQGYSRWISASCPIVVVVQTWWRASKWLSPTLPVHPAKKKVQANLDIANYPCFQSPSQPFCHLPYAGQGPENKQVAKQVSTNYSLLAVYIANVSQ